MDSLQDLLKAKRPAEPPQVAALRKYVKDHHDTAIKVSVSVRDYSITVPSATLATILRMELPQIQAECNLDKKLFIRIGHF